MADETAIVSEQAEQTPPPLETEPTEEPAVKFSLDQRKKLGDEVTQEAEGWRTPRRVHELQWFINAAYRRGKQTSEVLQSANFADQLAQINKRKKNIANKLWAKGRARFAKFVKNRPRPTVMPFTHERKDRLNARATERALDYFYERSDQEQKYIDVLLWTQDTGKAYWALHWNPDKMVAIQKENDLMGVKSKMLVDAPEGDIELEVFSAFEMLVPDLRLTHLKDQRQITRLRVMDVDDVNDRYKEVIAEIQQEEPDFKIEADSHMGSPFEFERQISHLSGSESGSLAAMTSDLKGSKRGVLVYENYRKPNAKYPNGRMIVAVNKVALRIQDELPHGFADMENPYPFVEFIDMPQVGQFYVTTFIEQLIPLQRGYNMLRDKLEAQIRMNIHPKWMVPKQARIPKASLTNDESEVVEWNYIPGMPEPHSITPGAIGPDAWRFLQMLKEEYDDISQIFPSFEGKAGTAKSGFQTNLLQEASDNVHSPDARGYELSIKDSAQKIRRMMKAGYTVPRLLSFAGKSSIPEVFEFSQDNIDEHATIRVQIGSGLSTFKAARIQQMMELYQGGLLGDKNDPELRRRVLSLIDLGGIEEFQERAARDEDMARSENIDILELGDIPVPQFYEDHMVHYAVHTDELKSPANKDLDPKIKDRMIAHVLLHMKFINPAAAAKLAMEHGLTKLLEAGLIPPPPPEPAQGQPQPGQNPQEAQVQPPPEQPIQ